MSDEAPDFLDLDDVLELHAMQLARYGGADGIRDRGLLESAVAQPQATFDGVCRLTRRAARPTSSCSASACGSGWTKSWATI